MIHLFIQILQPIKLKCRFGQLRIRQGVWQELNLCHPSFHQTSHSKHNTLPHSYLTRSPCNPPPTTHPNPTPQSCCMRYSKTRNVYVGITFSPFFEVIRLSDHYITQSFKKKQVVEAMKRLFVPMIFVIAFRNSLTWHLQRFWGASGNVWESSYKNIAARFGEENIALYGKYTIYRIQAT